MRDWASFSTSAMERKTSSDEPPPLWEKEKEETPVEVPETRCGSDDIEMVDGVAQISRNDKTEVTNLSGKTGRRDRLRGSCSLNKPPPWILSKKNSSKCIVVIIKEVEIEDM